MTIKVVTVGSETKVNVATASDQMYSSISALADGGWIETWQSLTQDGGGHGVYQRRYDAQGVAVGGETLVNLVTADHQSSPNVTGLANGGWVVTWQSNLQDGSGYGIYQRVYTAQGVRSGPDLLVNATTANEQQNASVTALSDGGWVVTWQSNLQDGSGYGVYQRHYTATGATVGPDILVNTSTGSDQQNPSVTALPNGGWVVSWMSHLQDGAGWGIYHRHFAPNSDGILTGGLEIATGTVADETLVVQPGSLNAGDQLMGGAGTDTLQMLSSGTIDLTAPGILSGFEAVVGSGGNDTVIVNASRFGAFTSFDGGAGADLLQFLGSGTYDTRGKTFAGIEKIVLSGGGAAVTVESVAIALLLRGSVEDHNSVTFAGGTFSAVERQQLFRQGIETIVDSSGTYISQPPSLNGLNGDSVTVADGETVLIDRGGDATVIDPMGSLRFLEVRVGQNGVSSEDRFGIGTAHGVSLSGGVTPGSLVAVNGIIIGIITSSGSELQVAFNGNATGALIQQLVRSLTYTNINEVDPAGTPRSISITLTDSTGAWTTATTIVTVDQANDAPTISGVAEAAQSVADDVLTAPFSGATILDADSPSLTVTITLDDSAKGTLLNLSGGLYEGQAGTYTLKGSAAEIMSALQALQFDPRDRFDVGSQETTTFTISISDGIAPAVTQIANVTSIASNRVPTAITLTGTSVAEHAGEGAVIGTLGAADPNGSQGLTFTLLNDGEGRFAIENGNLVLTGSGLLEATQTKAYPIQVKVTDAGGASYVQDFTITVHAEDDVPTLTGGPAAVQSVADDGVLSPFSTLFIADVDSPVLTVTVMLDDPANGVLLNLSGGSYDVLTGTYTLTGSSLEVTAALRALRFDPQDRPLALGQDETTTFTIKVQDGSGSSVTQDCAVVSTVSNRTPTGITLSGTTIDEHAASGVMIGLFGAADPNGDQGFTYTLLDDAGGRFTIHDGKLMVADASLLEATQPEAYQVRVQVVDAGGASHTETFDITVDARNDAPVLTGLAGAVQSVEDTQILSPFAGVTIADVDSPVLTVLVTMDNPANGTWLSLSGGTYNPQAGTYTLTGSAAQLATALQNLRFDPRDQAAVVGSVETTTFTIHVSDESGQDVSQTVVVDAITSNRAPTAITLSGVTIDEYAGRGAVIGALGALDANGSAGMSYTLLNDAGGRFALVDGNLVVASPNLLEAGTTTQYQIWLQVTDPAGASHTQSFLITVNAQDDAPMLTGVPTTAQTVEDLQTLSPFSAITVTDVDSLALRVTVTLDAPSKGALLNLNGGSYDAQTGIYMLTGSAAEITSALRALQFDPRDRPTVLGQDETTTSTIRVQDESGSNVSQTCTVISAVSNRAPTAITLSGTNIDEHAPKGAVIGMLDAIDPNGEQEFTYRLLDNAEGRFAITDGKLVVLNPQLLAADRIETYSIQVMATDAGGASYVQDFAITVDINHAPIADSQGNAASGDEDTTITGKVPAGTDADGDVLAYRLVAAVPGLTLEPDGSFSYKPAANFHGEITFQYQVVDSHGELSQPQAFTLIINPVSDAPVAASSGNSASGDEGEMISGKVPAGTDADGDTLTYRLATDVEGLTFNSDGSFHYTPADGFHGEIQFQYQVVDSHNLASELQTFTLIIRDITRPKDAVIDITGEEHGLNAAEATSSVAVSIAPDEGAHVVLAQINGMDLTLKDGIYSFDATKLQDGSYTMLVLTADDAGNPTITTKKVTVDTMAPAGPGITLSADTGVSGDLITSIGGLTVSGVEAGASVMYSTDGGKAWNSSFIATEGQNQIQVRQVDLAGNMSNIVGFTFTLDTTAPSNVSLSTTNVSENAAAGTVVGTLSATDADAKRLTYSLAPHGDADGRFILVTLDGTTSLVVKDGVKLDYEQATSHIVTVQVTDAAGNSSTMPFTIGVGDVRTEKVVGSATSDVLKSGSGNDKLYGGSGNDTLWGQSGKDVFVFDTKLGTSSSDRKVNFDTIKDFSVKDDGIWLDNAVFRKLGSGSSSKPKLLKKDFFKIGRATDKNDYVLYDKKTGVLSYDADGSGRGKAVEFAQLKKSLALTYKDFFVI